MMLDVLGEKKAADRVERAVMKVVAEDLPSLSVGKMGKTTTEIGDLVATYAS